MGQAIATFFLETLHLPARLCVLICSMIPVIELRGAIPLGLVLDLPLWECYFLSVIGNLLPVPLILLFIRSIIGWMSRSRIRIFNRFAGFLLRKVEKNRAKIEKYSFWGVALFVAVPLPITGAWTGSLVAAVIDMKFWKAFFSAVIGVLIAGGIVSGICLLVQNGVTWLSFLIG